MDPLTHALAGGAAARVALARPLGRAAFLPGAVAALVPDADVAIRSASDPLLYAEFHRHFTHALAFIPACGAVAALPWIAAPGTRRRWLAFLGATTVGCATHGVLDAATTYGTRLLWPFSDARVAWNWISIVDPLVTIVLLAGVGLALWRRSAAPAAVAVALCALYLGSGAAQRARALEVQARIAASRGHEPSRGDVFPGFGSNVVWRSVYEAGGRLFMDRIRVSWRGTRTWAAGPSAAALDAETAGTALDPARRRDLERFVHFTNGWIARPPGDAATIGDARYSMVEDAFIPVWSIQFTSGAARPRVQWIDRSSQRRVDPRRLVNELLGRDPSHGTVP